MSQKPLFIFELANNHNGSVEQAKEIISELKKICDFEGFKYAVKLQYRDLDTFITDEAKIEMSNPAVVRFLSNRLNWDEFLEIRDFISQNGFLSICTPFDEISVDKVLLHNYDLIKIASCSFTDWPLLEKIALCDKPLIASTAASSLEDIDRVVEFFTHRKKNISLMHCVGEYPTNHENFQLNQIDLLKSRYPEITVGYSTHESPENLNSIMIAVAKGARIFEKHVGIGKLNAYSAAPIQVKMWLGAAKDAFVMCGKEGERHGFSDKEKSDLWNFKRGVFADADIPLGTKIVSKMIRYAIPKTDGQFTADDMSKYNQITATSEIKKGEAICCSNAVVRNVCSMTNAAFIKVKELLDKSGIMLGKENKYEFSHHYGIERFFEYGGTLIELINRNYCKKIFIILPNQKHPTHKHNIKEESFHILYGSVDIIINDVRKTYCEGDIEHVIRGQRHSFESATGCVMEEISTRHYVSDSVYDDPEINNNENRKTLIDVWKD